MSQTTTCFLGTCHLDHSNSVFAGSSDLELNRYQCVKFPSSCCFVLTFSYTLLNPAWVSALASCRTQNKIKLACLTNKILNACTSTYLQPLLSPYIPQHSLQSFNIGSATMQNCLVHFKSLPPPPEWK